MMISRLSPSARRAVRLAANGARTFATRRKTKTAPLAPEILNNMPVFPELDDPAPASNDPAYYIRGPVSSAHCIDVTKSEVSALDSAAISPSGGVVHGKYGDLGPAALGIPLEYLALLRPAAEGAAGLRVLLENSSHSGHGTVLVYGASTANGFAAAQLASSAGHAVVGVVGADHSGNESLMESLKGILNEPGTAVPEEYALSKKKFADLVASISSGDEGIAKPNAEEYLKDFKANLLDYVEAYPDTRPAAVSEEHLEFKYMEKDREFFEQNMEAFLEQYPPGAPPIDPAKLEAFFSSQQYEIFRKKFWAQTSGIISGDDTPFSPPHLVKQMSETPEMLDSRTFAGAGPEVPYAFSITNPIFPMGSEPAPGGPVMGAIISVTPDLKAAAEKVAAAKTLRGKGEALQFLTKAQKSAYTAACSVAGLAKKAKAPVVVIGGSLPELYAVGEPTPEDVQEALKAMDIDDSGESRLNYFVQVYRASDYPFYADYAVHRATETLAGPRQIIVTK